MTRTGSPPHRRPAPAPSTPRADRRPGRGPPGATARPARPTPGPGRPARSPPAPFPEERCAANEAAGTITYLSGSTSPPPASIVDVVLADQAGYYDELCLDVELKPSFSTANYPIVASGDAEIASGGSFSEVVNFAAANDADLVAVDVEGRTAIDSLILKPGTATELEDLAGTTIGVKGAIPPSVAAMLAGAGLVEGSDYETVLLDGFDPLAHNTLDGIVGFPGYKSNEPGQLERAGVPFDLFDPTEYDVPGSFGVIFTTRQFLESTRRRSQDFLRATMRGSPTPSPTRGGRRRPRWTSSRPAATRTSCRWRASRSAGRPTPSCSSADPRTATGIGIPDLAALQAEVDAYAEVGLFGERGARRRPVRPTPPHRRRLRRATR